MRDLTMRELAVVAGGFLTNTGGTGGNGGNSGQAFNTSAPGQGGGAPGGAATANIFISPNSVVSDGPGEGGLGGSPIIIVSRKRRS
jgi:hypothetical protein